MVSRSCKLISVSNMETEDLLDERNKTHGSFIVNSGVSQTLKHLFEGTLTVEELEDNRKYFVEGYSNFELIHKEAIDLMCGKWGRIYAGQPCYNDHWADISGYAYLPIKFNHGKD